MPKKRILVVDDEKAITHFLKTNLERTGTYEVREENKGEHALAAALEFRPDLILLDVVMPDLDGAQVASQIKADGRLRDTRIVFLTGILDKQEAGPGATVIGGSHFIAKPIDLKELIQSLEKLLQS